MLQSIPAKAYANVFRARLSEYLGSQLLEQQPGYQARQELHRLTVQSRLVCKLAWNIHKTMFLCMLDLTKAFDCVDRTMAWHILLSRGCAQVGGAHQGLAHRQLSHHQSRAGLIFSLASSKAVIWHRVCSS